MARPIKETPVLTGKDAKRFEEQIKANEARKVPLPDYQKAQKTFATVKLCA